MLTPSRAFVLLLLLATAVTVFGYDGNYSESAPPFNITKPSSPVTWFIGETVTISWSIPTDSLSRYTGPDGFGCYVALFNSTDPAFLISYISQNTVFSWGSLKWTVSGNLVPGTTYFVGVGYGKYVVGGAGILIASPKTTLSEPAATTQTHSSTTHSSTSIPQNDTASPSQFSSVGGIGGLIGIVIGGTLILGGILSIMAYNSCHERKDHSLGPGRSLQYRGEGSSYVPRSDETSYANNYDGANAVQRMSPPTSPGVNATSLSSPSLQAALSGSASNRSTYVPFSKRNPNPHHDNVDLLEVDPFAKPVPAYILASEPTERPTDRQQRGGRSGRASEPEESRPYNFI